MQILKQAEGGVTVPELCCEHGMSAASFYKWRAKYGGMDASMIALIQFLLSVTVAIPVYAFLAKGIEKPKRFLCAFLGVSYYSSFIQTNLSS
jgi:hypothetical protein